MRNAMVTAFKEWLQAALTTMKILSPGYVSALESNNERALKLTINQFPAVLLDYRKVQKPPVGGGYEYVFNGDVIVAVTDILIDSAQYNLSDCIDAVMTQLNVRPKFQVNGKYVSLVTGESYPRHFGEASKNSFYLSEAIPCKVSFMHTS